MAKARVKVPKSVKAGKAFLVKTLISHKMETGLRKNKKTGKRIPKMIINKFVCNYGGKDVFVSDWEASIAANPYMAFYVKAKDSGPMNLTWTDDDGTITKKTVNIKVSG